MNKFEVWKRKTAREKARQDLIRMLKTGSITPVNAFIDWRIELGGFDSNFSLDLENELAQTLSDEIDNEILKSIFDDNS